MNLIEEIVKYACYIYNEILRRTIILQFIILNTLVILFTPLI